MLQFVVRSLTLHDISLKDFATDFHKPEFIPDFRTFKI